MKKVMFLILAFVLIAGLFSIGYTADENELPKLQVDRDVVISKNDPINKLERGLINLATFWLEVPTEVAKVSKEQDAVAGVTIGVVNGVVISAVRGVTAIYDTVTFFVPPYSKPVMKPEYAWKAADDKIRALLW